MAKAYIGYYGMILLKLSTDVAKELDELWEISHPNNDVEDECYYDKVLHYQQKIMKVLDKPCISNVRFIEKLRKEHYDPVNMYGDDSLEYLMRFSSPVIFDVDLPVDKRTYGFEVKYSKNLVEKFSVIYDGYVFLAYAPIELTTLEGKMLGPEIREFLLNILKCEDWEGRAITPCPVRTTFYVQSNENLKSDSLLLYEFNENIDNETYENNTEVADIMEFLYYRNAFVIEEFLSLMSLKRHIETVTWNIQTCYDLVNGRFKNACAKLYKRRLNKQIKMDIFSLYELLYQYDLHLYEYKTKRESLCEYMKEDVSEYIENYIKSEVNIDVFPQANVINGVKHIEETIDSERSNYYAMLAAVIGALSAIVVTLVSELII